jgi:transposase
VSEHVEEHSYERRKSGLKEHVEVTVRPERRRRWNAEEKFGIVRETLAPGAIVSVVARRHGIGTGLLYSWRKQALAGAMAGFMPIQITKDEAPVSVTGPGEDSVAPPAVPASLAKLDTGGIIEVILPTGVRLRVTGDVDGGVLRRVLVAVEGR